MNIKKYSLLPLVISGISVSSLYALELQHYKAHLKSGYEQIALTPTEDMGLAHIGVLFDIGEYWYMGIDVYGAVDGERGGFFTTGVDMGAKVPITKNTQIEGGVFVGAGGGGAAPQGGGLMLRPYIQASYLMDGYSLGIGASHIEFPNGDISSTQAYISMSMAADGGFLPSHHFVDDGVTDSSASTQIGHSSFSFLTEHYVPRAGSLDTDGVTQTQPYTLAGVKLEIDITPSIYTILQTAGAGGGSSDGFMEVLGGVGYRYPIADSSLYLNTEALMGAAGGGRVDTGGGVVYRAQAGASWKPTKELLIGVNAGTMHSIDGTLSTATYSATIGYTSSIIDHLSSDQNEPIETTTTPWSFRILNKSYTDAKSLFSSSKPFDRIDLLGFGLDRYITPNIYLTGQTYWAYKGGAGGYAEGIVGVGYHTDRYGGFGGYAELLGGVGGGGGVSIGGGFFGSVGAGLSYQITKDSDIFVGGAYEKSKDGTFDTFALQAGVRYSFSLLELR